MARPRKPIDPLRQKDQLIEILENQKPGWERERLLALKKSLEGKTSATIALDLKRSPTTIKTWIDKFRAGGVDGLLSKDKGNGPQSELTAEMQAGMTEQLRLGKWRTGKDAWKWLEENFDVSHLKQSVIYKYLGKCEGRLKATRPSNPTEWGQSPQNHMNGVSPRKITFCHQISVSRRDISSNTFNRCPCSGLQNSLRNELQPLPRSILRAALSRKAKKWMRLVLAKIHYSKKTLFDPCSFAEREV